MKCGTSLELKTDQEMVELKLFSKLKAIKCVIDLQIYNLTWCSRKHQTNTMHDAVFDQI